MTPDEPLSRWEVNSMIDAKIERYDLKQDQRHRENTQKLDRNVDAVIDLTSRIENEFKEVRASLAAEKSALSAQQGIDKYKSWFFPSLLTFGLVIIGIIDLFKK